MSEANGSAKTYAPGQELPRPRRKPIHSAERQTLLAVQSISLSSDNSSSKVSVALRKSFPVERRGMNDACAQLASMIQFAESRGQLFLAGGKLQLCRHPDQLRQ